MAQSEPEDGVEETGRQRQGQGREAHSTHRGVSNSESDELGAKVFAALTMRRAGHTSGGRNRLVKENEHESEICRSARQKGGSAMASYTLY